MLTTCLLAEWEYLPYSFKRPSLEVGPIFMPFWGEHLLLRLRAWATLIF